tara:strand:+ start:185 stop:793 length:609 start_codon:yes stop_codon:yes gene_type:complete
MADRIPDKVFGGMRRSLEASLKIQEDFPNLFDLYVEEGSALNVVKAYDLGKKYSLSQEQAERAIYGAIQGYGGGFGIKSFKGLVDQKTWEEARFQKRSDRGREVGLNGRTSEEKHTHSLEGVEARGVTHWFNENENGESEIAYAYRLSRDEKFQHMTGPYRGKTDCKKIAKELKKVYGHDRSNLEVRKAIHRYKKSIENPNS